MSKREILAINTNKTMFPTGYVQREKQEKEIMKCAQSFGHVRSYQSCTEKKLRCAKLAPHISEEANEPQLAEHRIDVSLGIGRYMQRSMLRRMQNLLEKRGVPHMPRRLICRRSGLAATLPSSLA